MFMIKILIAQIIEWLITKNPKFSERFYSFPLTASIPTDLCQEMPQLRCC